MPDADTTADDVDELRAQAEGSRPFVEREHYERLALLDSKEWRALPQGARLAVGYYLAAKRRAASPAGAM